MKAAEAKKKSEEGLKEYLEKAMKPIYDQINGAANKGETSITLSVLDDRVKQKLITDGYEIHMNDQTGDIRDRGFITVCW